MKVSVVVANHGRDLTNLRKSLVESTHKDYELIVIDRGLERSLQRNLGISKAAGEIILWLDSDQTISKELMEECVDLVKCGFSAIYVPEVIVADSLFGKIRAYERTFYDGTAVDVPRAVLRSVCPKFNEELNGPEDSDFGNRIVGLRTISKNVLYHHDDISVGEYFRKKAYYAKSMRKYQELNPNDKVLNWKYRCITIFLENGKWKKIIRHPILFMGVIAIILARAVIYLCKR